MMKKICILFLLVFPLLCSGQNLDVRFGNEATDTTAITAMLIEAQSRRFANPEARVSFFGHKFEGVPYVAHTLEGEPEILTVMVDSLDCTTFVETALALAFTAGEQRSSWRDYVYNLRRLRYRGGETDGYPSRLHYIADWAVDNIHRGNLQDATNLFPKHNHVVRSIDFMSRHADRYPALADSANLARIRSIESGYRNHRFPYIKTVDLSYKPNKAAFHDGDVVAFVSNLNDLDVTHMGIIVRESPTAEPYVMHASSRNGKVEVTTLPLYDFMKKNRQWIGVRVFRLLE